MDVLCENSYCSLVASMKEAGTEEFLDVSFDPWEETWGNLSNQSLPDLEMSVANQEQWNRVQGSGGVTLRILIAVVYSVVCALGLVGNLLVLYLMKSKQGWKKSSINLFVTCLAATDFQFVLTLPFWAAENALDFTWLFGRTMCKILTTVTAMNMYASVFFLTAMSVARYHSVASALKAQRRGGLCGGCRSAKWLCLLIWTTAILAALPTAIFSTTITLHTKDEEFCLVKIPDSQGNGTFPWRGLYKLQKVLLGFVVPLGIITLSYLLLVRFISDRHVGAGSCGPSTKRRSRVTKSVTVVVLSFFLCWLPNQALTTWGMLMAFNALPFSQAYYLSQVYLFPITVCLAHSNSCLNPIFYCLMRKEFRKALKKLLWKVTAPSLTTMRPFTATSKPEQEDKASHHALMPVRSGHGSPTALAAPALLATVSDVISYPPGVVVYSGRCDVLPAGGSAETHC